MVKFGRERTVCRVRESLPKRMLPTMGFTSVPSRKQKGKISWILNSGLLDIYRTLGYLLSLSQCVYDSSSGPNFDLWPSGKLFGQVTQFESLEMNKMHLIEKTFIRNRFEVHGRGSGRVISTYGRSIHKFGHHRGRLWECHKVSQPMAAIVRVRASCGSTIFLWSTNLLKSDFRHFSMLPIIFPV